MSQRNSEYERKDLDLYETPEWVTEVLIPHIPKRIHHIWEPACGNGKMSNVLRKYIPIWASDIKYGDDFFDRRSTRGNAIVTNPPFKLSREFIEHALELMKPIDGFVAMLLKVDYDSAKTRRHLFADCEAFSKKVVLTKRIAWFVEADGKPKASPSENHAWYIWDWRHEGPPTIVYAP